MLPRGMRKRVATDSESKCCELLPGIVSFLQGGAKVSSTLLVLWGLA